MIALLALFGFGVVRRYINVPGFASPESPYDGGSSCSGERNFITVSLKAAGSFL